MFEYNLRFPGQQYDAVVGLHYNYFRDYDPAVGRYTQSDPIGLRGGVNTFAYVRARPVSNIDVLGLADSRRHPRSPGAPYVPGIGEVLVPNTPANDAWVSGASQAIDRALNPPNHALKEKAPPKDDGDEDDASKWCPGPGGTTCPEWRVRLMQYYENVVMIEIITGNRNESGRATYAFEARRYNQICGLISGRVPDSIFDQSDDDDIDWGSLLSD